jgi:hypothetical protein
VALAESWFVHRGAENVNEFDARSGNLALDQIDQIGQHPTLRRLGNVKDANTDARLPGDLVRGGAGLRCLGLWGHEKLPATVW